MTAQRHLPIINCYDGQEYRIGQYFLEPNSEAMREDRVALLDVYDNGFFSAKAKIQRPGEEPRWIPLIVRLTHPQYFLRRVAFIPT